MAMEDSEESHRAQPWTDDEDDGDEETQVGDLDMRSQVSGLTPSALPLPVWMRESSKSFRWRWVPLPLRKAARRTVTWVEGPQPPTELKIKPLLPFVQEAPIRFMDKYVPNKKHRCALLVFLYFCWFLTWSLVLRHSSGSGYIPGYGKPQDVWCGYRLWGDGNDCGVNGNDCRPFADHSRAFRCPANCRSIQVLEPHYVGDQKVVYDNYVIGGPSENSSSPIYRADSFICQAAIHAGVITNTRGGCGVYSLTGSYDSFASSNRHGIRSTAFPAPFPKTYTFEQDLGEISCPRDTRWPLLVITVIPLLILGLFTTSPSVFFFSTFFILFLQVALVSDPPNVLDISSLISIFLGRLLPATFISYILYIFCVTPLLTGLTAQFEKTIFYLGLALIGALNNYTFAVIIPIQRLTPKDISSQPGAKLALIIIVCLVVAIILGQIHYIRVSGQLLKYLKLYALMGVGLLILLALPNLRLRIHHYILALLFIPGTALQTRPSLIYQGLLLGLFINGVARWGFASIVQTPAMLGESPSSGSGGSGRWWGSYTPNVTAVVAPDARNIRFHWGALPSDIGVEGVSVLVNDVERWRAYSDEELGDGSQGNEEGFVWRRAEGRRNGTDFFRFAWMRGRHAGKYSRPGVWDKTGVWREPEEGWEAEGTKIQDMLLDMEVR